MPTINSLSKQEQDAFLENTYDISFITLEEDIQHTCPLGEQIGITHYDIEVIPRKHLAELVALHWSIQEMVGTKFTLESGCEMVLQKVKEAYQDAEWIRVKASCGKNRHMPATVEIEYQNNE